MLAAGAWHSFVPPTLAEDRNWYSDPKGRPDVRLECECDADNDPEMERHVLRRACEGVWPDELRTLSMCTEGVVWSTDDWYEMYVESIRITHGLERPGRSILHTHTSPPSVSTSIKNTTSITSSSKAGSGGSGDTGRIGHPERVMRM